EDGIRDFHVTGVQTCALPILTFDNIVIELQNSPISKSMISDREDFYGKRMLWLVNGIKFKNNLKVKDYWEDQDYIELKSLPRPRSEERRVGKECRSR